MEISYYKKFEPIDGKWIISKELGSGSFGTVFEVHRTDFPDMKSALKIISIPNSQTEISSFRDENYDLDEQTIVSYYYGIVEEVVQEFQIMSKLKGHSNIVNYEDHDVKRRENEIGWDIFIRMELLTPMNKYFAENNPTQKDVIRLGIDICKALEICQKYQIIHRDIKPSNIFISKTGDFKLGDFGVARTLERTSSGLSKKGTYTYMAPEVFKGEAYGTNVDTYSLGIVMYKLLNNNLEPFRTDRTYGDSEKAFEKRVSGAEIPAPANAKGKLAEIVLKACSFNPKERYESPSQMREELENIFYNVSEKNVVYPEGDNIEYDTSTKGETDEKTVSPFGDFTVKEDDKTVSMFDIDKTDLTPIKKGRLQKKNKKKIWIPLGSIAVILICILAFGASKLLAPKDNWTGFIHRYDLTSEGMYADGKGADETGEKFKIDSDTIKVIIEDNIPQELPLDKEYPFEFSIASAEKPTSVMVLAGKGGGSVDFDYVDGGNGTSTVNINLPLDFEKVYYSAGDKIRFRIVIEYKTENADGSAHYEQWYLDKTALTLTGN